MPISHPLPCLVTSRLLPPVEGLGVLGMLESIGVIEVIIEIGCAHYSLLTTHYSLN